MRRWAAAAVLHLVPLCGGSRVVVGEERCGLFGPGVAIVIPEPGIGQDSAPVDVVFRSGAATTACWLRADVRVLAFSEVFADASGASATIAALDRLVACQKTREVLWVLDEPARSCDDLARLRDFESRHTSVKFAAVSPDAVSRLRNGTKGKPSAAYVALHALLGSRRCASVRLRGFGSDASLASLRVADTTTLAPALALIRSSTILCPLADEARPWWVGGWLQSGVKQISHPESVFDAEEHPETLPCAAALEAQLPPVPRFQGPVVASRALYLGEAYGKASRRPGDVLYAVASSIPRGGTGWRADRRRVMEAMLARTDIEREVIEVNATDGHDAAQLRAWWRAIGVAKACADRTGGKVGWWNTYVRFLVLLLTSKFDYGVLLQDDAELPADFGARVQRLLAIAAPLKRWSFRLGQYQIGLLIPREAAARALNIFCSDMFDCDEHCDHYHIFAQPELGDCPLTITGRPFNALVNASSFHSKSTIKRGSSANIPGTSQRAGLPQDRHPLLSGDDWPPFCKTDWPGKVNDVTRLAVRFEGKRPREARKPKREPKKGAA
ncbi:hypothetical protein M885DRAFT_521859 [Pelagophyceae sp. CCMP2097]|nr:hypothetical protein M885DRAFT_521859 [Pelagophyceae sp. CCMP2097]